VSIFSKFKLREKRFTHEECQFAPHFAAKKAMIFLTGSSVREEGLEMFRTLGAVALVSFVAIASPEHAASQETIECRARPESREYWSWREIEGRRCWYKGHRRIDKKLLSWGPKKPVEAVKLDPAMLQEGPLKPSVSPAEPIEAESVYQAAERNVSSIGPFEATWRDLMADMKFQDRIQPGE
jgi:hypothetical protein